MTPHTRTPGPGWAESILALTPARLILAGIFGLAAFFKIGDPQEFAFAIKGFNVFDSATQSHLITVLAFGIPWAEMIIAVLLVLGLWTRAAASLLTVMLIGFTIALIGLMRSDSDASCACFGDLEFGCTGPIGWCHMGRNAGLIALSVLLVWRGGGRLSVDQRHARLHGGASDEVDSDAGRA